MTVKQVLKKYEANLTITNTKELRIIDIPNHWEVTIKIKELISKPLNKCFKKLLKLLNKYFKKLLRRKIMDIYWEADMLTLEIY